LFFNEARDFFLIEKITVRSFLSEIPPDPEDFSIYLIKVLSLLQEKEIKEEEYISNLCEKVENFSSFFKEKPLEIIEILALKISHSGRKILLPTLIKSMPLGSAQHFEQICHLIEDFPKDFLSEESLEELEIKRYSLREIPSTCQEIWQKLCPEKKIKFTTLVGKTSRGKISFDLFSPKSEGKYLEEGAGFRCQPAKITDDLGNEYSLAAGVCIKRSPEGKTEEFNIRMEYPTGRLIVSSKGRYLAVFVSGSWTLHVLDTVTLHEKRWMISGADHRFLFSPCEKYLFYSSNYGSSFNSLVFLGKGFNSTEFVSYGASPIIGQCLGASQKVAPNGKSYIATFCGKEIFVNTFDMSEEVSSFGASDFDLSTSLAALSDDGEFLALSCPNKTTVYQTGSGKVIFSAPVYLKEMSFLM